MAEDDPDFDGVRDMIKSFKKGEIDEEEALDLYKDVDGIERTIAVGRAKRNQSMGFEELDERTSIDVHD